MNIRDFNQMMELYLGEAGAEAVIDAIAYALMNAKDEDFSAGDYDKFVLLSILMDNPHTGCFKKEYNPVLNFSLSFKSAVSSNG